MIGVSFIVTIYNKEKCLLQMVESLKQQEGDFAREFIFIDDGSTDNSLAEIQALTKAMDNVKIISQPNQGPSVAINQGIKHSSLSLIKLLDGDDMLLPDATISLINAMVETKCKVVRAVHVNDYKDITNKNYNGEIKIIKNSLKKAVRFLPIGGSTCLLDAALVKAVGGCDERVFVQDYSISLRLAMHSDFAVLNKVVACNIDSGQQRLSSNKLRENRDTALARFYFMHDHQELSYDYKREAFKMHLRKSWSWYRKHHSWPYFSKYMYRWLISKMPLIKFSDDLIYQWMEEALEVYSYVK